MKFYHTVMLVCTLFFTGPSLCLILTVKPSNPMTALIVTYWLKNQTQKNCVNVSVDSTKTFQHMLQEAEQKIKNSWKLPVQVCTHGDARIWALVG